MAVSALHRWGYGPIVLAAAVPLLFLHVHYQPSVSVASASADLSDAAVAAICLTAILTARRAEIVALRRVALLLGPLAIAVFAWTAWGSTFAGYPAGTHLVTAAKWDEYMLLAPAVVLIVRRPLDLLPAAYVAVAWSVVVSLVGVLQFLGALGDLEGTPPGRRKSSLLGYHDFSAFSAAVLVLALVVAVTGRGSRRVALVAGVSGIVGMVIGGAFDAVVGEVVAAVALVAATRLRDRKRLAVVAAALLLVIAGTFAIRSQAVADGLKFLGVKRGSGGAAVHVQSYRQRVLLAYIGGRIFLDHPLLGVGFDGSSDAYAYDPYLAAAKKRFTQPPEAFPSPAHPWGVQNAYVQLLADMGPIGLLAFLSATLVPAVLALRRPTVAALGAGAVGLVALGVWNGFGLVAGIPLDALTWLAAGAALAQRSWPRANDPLTS